MKAALTGALAAFAVVYVYRRLQAMDADITRTHQAIDDHAKQVLALTALVATRTKATEPQWQTIRFAPRGTTQC